MFGTVYLTLKARRDAEVCWKEAKNLLLNQQGRGLTAGQTSCCNTPSCNHRAAQRGRGPRKHA